MSILSRTKKCVVVGVQALVGALHIVKLPTVGIRIMVLEYVVILVKVWWWFRPVLNIAFDSDSTSRVQWRATKVRIRILAASGSGSTGTTHQIALHLVFGDMT
jgi:hypothetical protein